MTREDAIELINQKVDAAQQFLTEARRLAIENDVQFSISLTSEVTSTKTSSPDGEGWYSSRDCY